MWRKVSWIFLVFYFASVTAKDTELSLYRPLTVTDKYPIAKVIEKIAGSCWQQSHLIKREDAWRCIAQGKTYDPCFVKPFSEHKDAYCLSSPWATTAVQITMTTPLDNHQHIPLDMSKAFPWGIELVSGEKCYAIEPSIQYDGLDVHYRCENNTELFGDIHRCSSVWEVLQHRLHGVATVEITRAWF